MLQEADIDNTYDKLNAGGFKKFCGSRRRGQKSLGSKKFDATNYQLPSPSLIDRDTLSRKRQFSR